MPVSNMFDLESDSGLRRLLSVTAWLLIVYSLFSALGASWPLGFGNMRWRLATTNNFVMNLQMPLLGFVLLLGLARSGRETTAQRVIGILGAIFTVALIVGAGLFVLDSLQLRKIVSSKDMEAYDVAIFRVTGALLIHLVGYIVLTMVAFKSPGGPEKDAYKKMKRNPVTDEPTGFLIGQDLTK